MRTYFVLLLILLLTFSPALADTLAQQVNAPERITGEFFSASVKTRVSVDATIHIPAADSLHRWEVRSRLFTTDELAQAADMFFGVGQWQFEDTGTTALRYHSKGGSSRYPFQHCQLNSLDPVKPSQQYLHTMYTTVNILGHDYHHFNGLMMESSVGNTSRQIGTEAAAQAIADSFVQALWPDMALDSIDPEKANLSGRSYGPGGSQQYGYRLYYSRRVEGVSVTPVYMSGATDNRNTAYIPPLPYERLYVDVGADGIFALRYEYPIEIVGLLEENVALLTFEQIWSVFGSIAPLTITHLESNSNNALYIDRIVLGYMCVQLRDEPARYQLLPVWDFFGKRTMREDTYAEHNLPLVTISAIDGTVIDRDYGY